MSSTAPKMDRTIEELTLNVTQEIHVRASLEVTFAALLEQLGPQNDTTDGKPMPMKIEPWPGGRWYRDLGGENGHFWGHVQAIKRPTLLEITGPLFMSFPVVSNVQYRLSEVDGGTNVSSVYCECDFNGRGGDFHGRAHGARRETSSFEKERGENFV